MKSIKLLGISFCIASAFLLTHCTKNDGSITTQTNANIQTVRLGYFANLTHAQAVIGVETGEIQQAIAPAKLQTKIFNAGPSLMEALFAGEIDIAYVGPGPALNAYQKSKGQEVRVIAGAAANGVLIVASNESKITTLEGLKGKKIATPQLGNTQDMSARHFIKSKFGQAALNEVIPIPNAEQASLMSRGAIAAAWAPEPWGTVLIKQNNAKLVAAEKDLWPNKQFILTVVTVSKKFLTEQPQILEKFLSIHGKLTDQLVATPEKYIDTMITALEKLTSKKLGKDIIESAMKNIQFTTDPMPATFETYAQWKEDLDMGKSNVPLTQLFEAYKSNQNRNITSDATNK